MRRGRPGMRGRPRRACARRELGRARCNGGCAPPPGLWARRPPRARRPGCGRGAQWPGPQRTAGNARGDQAQRGPLQVGAGAAGLDGGGERGEQVRQMWTEGLGWATSNPEKRGARAQLEVADDITADSHRTVRAAFRGIADLLERSRASGPMRDAPLGFVLALTNAIADTTIDAVIREPAEAEVLSSVAFHAIWRVLAGPTVPATA